MGRPLLALLLFLTGVLPASRCSAAGLWSTGYYPGYRQGAMNPTNVDFGALTHIIQFNLAPNSNATVSLANSLTTAYITNLVAKTHAAGKKILISVAGSGAGGFRGATTNQNRGLFVTNLVNFMSTYNYDGIDIDWEPLLSSEANQYTNFIKQLRTNLNSFNPPRLLTVATAQQETWFGRIHTQFDQINLMTYSMSGAYPGWITWHNAPIYDGGHKFPSTGGLVPSAEGMVNDFIAAGVPASKLGIGVAFYGCMWAGGTGGTNGGVTAPLQSYATDPTNSEVNFSTIMSTYYTSNRYHWDDTAQTCYLSIDNPGSTNDMFISYDDERTCQSKVSYARNRGLGGIMIWELGEGYRSTQPVGKRDPLLQAIKQSMTATPNFTGIQRTNKDLLLSFNTMPLASYRVQWSTNPASTVWNTLTNGVIGSGAAMQIADRNAVTNPGSRFYRVRTPP